MSRSVVPATAYARAERRTSVKSSCTPIPPWYSGAVEVIEKSRPCAGVMSHTASSVSLAHGAAAYAVTVSTTAVAPGESVRSTMNLVDRSRAPRAGVTTSCRS